MDDSRKWWKAKNYKGEVAHVPHTIVTKVNQQPSPDIYNNPLYARGRPVSWFGDLIKDSLKDIFAGIFIG